MELNWEEEGSSCTRRAEVEGLAQGLGLVLAAQGGAESLAPGPAPGRDQGPGPDRCLVAVPGPGHGQGSIQREFNPDVNISQV